MKNIFQRRKKDESQRAQKEVQITILTSNIQNRASNNLLVEISFVQF